MKARRVPYVSQLSMDDCGAACLAMVLAHHGRHVPLHELREMTGTSRDGVDALGMVQAARRYGLRAQGVAADVDAVAGLAAGTVLHWEFRHFVVLERVRPGGVDVVDPARGRRRVPMEEFRRSYTGVAIGFEPEAGFHRSPPERSPTWRYLRPLLGERGILRRVVATSVLIRVLALALPILTGVIVDDVTPGSDRHLLAIVGLSMVAVVGYHVVASLVRAHLLLQLRTLLDVRLATGFVDHLVNLPFAFFLRRTAGDVLMRLQSTSAVRDVLTNASLAALLDGGFGTLSLIVLAIVSPALAAVVCILGLGQVIVSLFFLRRARDLMTEILDAEARSQSCAYEMLSGIETLKASGAEEHLARRWQRLFFHEMNLATNRERLYARSEAAVGTLQIASPLAILLYGAVQVLEGNLSLGTMLAATMLATGVLEPLVVLVATGLEMTLVRSYMDRINDVLDSPRENEGRPVVLAPPLRGDVRAEGVSFRYSPTGPLVVEDVSFAVGAGQWLGIVGRSGAGKSTLAQLLIGLHTPTAGSIRYDGMELSGLDLRSLRRQIGIVTQRPYLFGSSIRDNIAGSDPEVDLTAVVEAARVACIDDDIAALPMGYDTRLSEAGSSLSGGQQQRIALARAVLHRPRVLLLDEATSDLDSVTEQIVQENLRRLGATTIVISHRLSTIAEADTILVMAGGRVVEEGTHHELLALAGTYSRLVGSQAGLE